MHLQQKIKQKIFFLKRRFFGKNEPIMVDKADFKSSIRDVIQILNEQNIQNILIVCPENLEKEIQLIGLKEELQKSDLKITLFDGVVANPSITLVEQGVHLFFSKACQAILAIGGGSCIDLAKAVKARIIRSNRSLHKLAGFGKINATNKSLPILIACPTSISASVSSSTAWIIDHPNRVKYIFTDRSLVPNYVINCKELFPLMPNPLLIETGLGTLVQAIEANLSLNKSRVIQEKSRLAVNSIFEILNNYNPHQDKSEQIEKLQQAAFETGCISGQALSGYATAIANALAVFYDLPYRETASSALPLVLEFYAKTKADFNLDSNSFPIDEILTQVDDLLNAWSVNRSFPQIKDQDIPELIAYIKYEVRSFHAPPVFLSDDNLNQILNSLIAKA